MNEEENYVQIDLLNKDYDWFDDEYFPEEEQTEEEEREEIREHQEIPRDEVFSGSEGQDPYFLHSMVKILVMLFIAYLVVRFILGAWLAMFVFFVVSAIFISLYVNW